MIRCGGAWFDSMCASRFEPVVVKGNAELGSAFAANTLTNRSCSCHRQPIANQLSSGSSCAHWLAGVEVEFLAALWSRRTAGLRTWSANQICHTIVSALERFLDPAGVLHDSTSVYGDEHVTYCMVNTEPSGHSGTYWVAVGCGFAFDEQEMRSQAC